MQGYSFSCVSFLACCAALASDHLELIGMMMTHGSIGKLLLSCLGVLLGASAFARPGVEAGGRFHLPTNHEYSNLHDSMRASQGAGHWLDEDKKMRRGEGRERMSPEERRQLRRDIDTAGRELYRERQTHSDGL